MQTIYLKFQAIVYVFFVSSWDFTQFKKVSQACYRLRPRIFTRIRLTRSMKWSKWDLREGSELQLAQDVNYWRCNGKYIIRKLCSRIKYLRGVWMLWSMKCLLNVLLRRNKTKRPIYYPIYQIEFLCRVVNHTFPTVGSMRRVCTVVILIALYSCILRNVGIIIGLLDRNTSKPLK